MKPTQICPLLLVLLGVHFYFPLVAAPVVSNVRAAQRPGTQLVDIYYDLADATNSAVSVGVVVSTNGGSSYFLWASSVGGDVGGGVTPGANKKITWNAGADWPGQYSANVRFRVVANDQPPTNFLALYIGNSGNNAAEAQATYYRINQGNPIGLAWTNNFSPGQYPNCSTFASGPKGTWPSWDSAIVTNSGELDLGSTSNVDAGTYTFGIVCTADPNNPNPPLPVSATVTLSIIGSTTIGEQ